MKKLFIQRQRKAVAFGQRWIMLVAAGVIAAALIPAGVRAQVEQTQPSTPPPVPAKHDSNTLHRWGRAIQYPFQKAGKHLDKSAHKAGSAIQYPVRKTGENASVTTHTMLGKKSVVHNRQTGRDEVVSPTTQVTPTTEGAGSSPANTPQGNPSANTPQVNAPAANQAPAPQGNGQAGGK